MCFRSPSILFTLLVAAAVLCQGCRDKKAGAEDEFLRLSNVGRAQIERGDATAATTTFEKALALNTAHPDAKLNLACALLLSEQDDRAAQLAQAVIGQDRDNAAAYYLAGVAENHRRRFTEAVQLLTLAKNFDKTVNPVSFQLGLAYEGLTNHAAAIEQFEEIEQFDPEFPALHYRLAQLYLRTGRQEDATKQMEAHRAWLAKHPNASLTAAALERCIYTQARVPFKPEPADPTGVRVVFVDVSAQAFAQGFLGPAGVIDFAHDGRNHLLVRDGDSFRVLVNSGGKFATNGQSFPFTNGGNYARWLVADLNKDGVPDAVVLGDRGVHLFRFTTNGTATETTLFAGLKNFAARDGILADLNFRGDLDIIAVGTNGEARVMSNLQNMYFVDTTTNLPALAGARGFAMEDWDNDEVQDLFVARESGAPVLLLRQRGGGFSNAAVNLPAGGVFAVGDMDNDLRPDVVVAGGGKVGVLLGNGRRAEFAHDGFVPAELRLVDYDNDGWLDVVALGASASGLARTGGAQHAGAEGGAPHGLRVWRNAGAKGFVAATAALGLDKVTGRVESLAAADFDGDGDTDFVVGVEGALRFLRNDGGNANHQLKLTLRGTRSNASALGTGVEVVAGGLRQARRITALPVEIGLGKHARADSVTAQWIELTTTQEDVPAGTRLTLIEPSINTGSCPFLYAWDGERFRFVTDILGSAPLGLPVAPGKYIEADEDEIVWLGDETKFKPRGSNYVVQLTEELREVLYLDEVKLVVVDHAPGTEVHATDKLRARRPEGGFPRGEIVTLGNRQSLRHAVTHEGRDVTATLSATDGDLVSPKLRESQYRGLAEPHSVALDFGALDTARPLALALTGWLRFGGGTANMAASSRPDFPFPFPVLEVETVEGEWRRLEVEVGAPSGKTKTIILELAGKLPAGARRLRIAAAFEIHWDRMALFEKLDGAGTRVARVVPAGTHLHARGYSEFANLPWTQPLTPVYEKLRSSAPWRVTPGGWATRYGAVDELVLARDNALALIAGGDELTLEFARGTLPPEHSGMARDFFLFTSGWDKDADYHVAAGTTLTPLPWHGLDDQAYGTQLRPAFTNDAWMRNFNTRWVGSRILSQR